MLIQEADHYELLTRPQGNAVFNPERRLGPTLDAASQSIAFEQRQSQKNQAQDQQQGCGHLDRSQPKPQVRAG